jgi:hypothetical protein
MELGLLVAIWSHLPHFKAAKRVIRYFKEAKRN